MSKSLPDDHLSDDPLQSLIADFLDAEGRGQPMDRDAWLAQHSSHADSLKDFLTNHDRMKNAASMSADDFTLPPNSHTHSDATLPPDVATSTRSREASVGDRLRYFGDYELMDEIARGGMGVVYKALQINLNRIVALKMILAGQLASEQDVQRFRTEAESAANLDHPRIVPIYEVGQHAGQHYFSMGFVDGKSLAQKIVDGPMAPRDAAEMLVKICEGIAYAHERGVIHRDLKPANILLDQYEQPKVTDFGLAKKLGSDSNLTGTGQILGTPSYMAPEQASGKIDEVGPLAEIYSLGAILYCLLAGRPPFQASNPIDTLLQVLDKEPIPLRQLNATIPVDLETICLKCLDKGSSKRYGSAALLSQELQRYLNGEPILARPTSAWERSLKWAKRRPAIAGLSLAILLACITGLTGITWQWREAVTSRQIAVEQKRIAELERDVTNRSLYVANMHLARQAWESGEITQLQKVLQQSVPQEGQRDLRGWEWQFLSEQSRSVLSLLGHSMPIRSLAWSPDGRRLASSASEASPENGELKIWDTTTGRELFALESRAGYGITSVAWSPDGKLLASGGGRNGGFQNRFPGELKIWNTQTGSLVQTLTGHMGEVNSVAFSPDGRYLASAAGGFGPPGQAKIWDCESGKELRELAGHENQVTSVAWRPDGQQLATTTSHGTIKIWDANSAEVVHSLQVPRSCHKAIWSPDGKKLATFGADEIHRIWDAASGSKLLEIPPAEGVQQSWAAGSGWLEDSEHITWINNNGTITVWDLSANKAIETAQSSTRSIQSAAWRADHQRFALAGSDQVIKIYDAAPAPEALKIDCGGKVALTTDGNRLATMSNDVKVWDTVTGSQLQTWSWPPKWFVMASAWSPDGKRLVSSGARSFPGGIKMWDSETEQELHAWSGHVGPPASIAWKRDGSCFATGGMDKLIKIWDADEPGNEIRTLEGHTGDVPSVAWHPTENRLASASRDGSVKLWNLSDTTQTMMLVGHSGAAVSVDWSPDGKRLVSSGIDGIKIWDSQTGTELLSLRGHSDMVHSVAWQPGVRADLQRVASISTDGTLKLWDLESGQEVFTFRSKSPFGSVAWTPDGKRLIASSMTDVKIWKTTSEVSKAQALAH